ncbi:MAG: alpha/beta fold hydrolase [Elusimicrobia bacterium]|nr:alpha/beta fold hydrolase [Elusimicrobiota bacterium]
MELAIKILVRAILYPAIAYLIVSLIFFYLYVKPSRYVSPYNPDAFGLEYEEISFKTSDNIEISAWFLPAKKPPSNPPLTGGKSPLHPPFTKGERGGFKKAVIICHGYPMDKGNLLETASFLAKEYNVLLFDFRAMGKSKGAISTGGWKETRDFLAAVDFLKKRGFKDIGAFGFSLGGAVVLMANSPDIKAIVVDSSYENLNSVLDSIFSGFGIFGKPIVWLMKFWGRLFFNLNTGRVSPADSIADIKKPVLLIHCEKDSQIPVSAAKALHSKKPGSELWIIPEADHGQGHMLTGMQYEKKVLEFFRKNL